MLWISRDARIKSEVILEAEVLSSRAGLSKQAALNKFVLVQVHFNDKQLPKWDFMVLLTTTQQQHQGASKL